MANLNEVRLMGRIGNDLILKDGKQKSMVSFSLATAHIYKDSKGEKQEVTNWIPVTFWGPKAEAIATYCKKGSSLFIAGHLTSSDYEDKDGKKIYKTEVTGDSWQFLEPKPKDS